MQPIDETCKPGASCPNPSKHEIKLFRKLKDLGIDSQLNYWDGEKRIDLAIPGAKVHVRIDRDENPGNPGPPEVVSETKAAVHTSDDPVHTIWIGSRELREKTDRVAKQIERIVKHRMDGLLLPER